jgi:hypothetical protein
MKPFHYHNIETKKHHGKHITRRVYVKNDKGYKCIIMQKGRGKRYTVKRPLKMHEITKIQKGKFMPRLFDDCKKCMDKNNKM